MKLTCRIDLIEEAIGLCSLWYRKKLDRIITYASDSEYWVFAQRYIMLRAECTRSKKLEWLLSWRLTLLPLQLFQELGLKFIIYRMILIAINNQSCMGRFDIHANHIRSRSALKNSNDWFGIACRWQMRSHCYLRLRTNLYMRDQRFTPIVQDRLFSAMTLG